MAIGRRDSQARRALVAAGRARVAIMAAVAAAGVAAPALAQSDEKPFCLDDGKDTVIVKGQEVPCRPKPKPQPPPAPGPVLPPPAEPKPPAEPDPVPPPAPTPPAAEPSPGATQPDADGTPSPQGAGSGGESQHEPGGGQQPAGENPTTVSTTASSGAAPSVGRGAAATPIRPDARSGAGSSNPHGKHHKPGDTPTAAGHRPGRHVAAKRERHRTVRARAARPHTTATYAALPASWTSLSPLILPVDGVLGFPIPPFLLPIYQAAAAQYGVPWEILASINEIETGFGENTSVSSAGALGWMQFMPGSWRRWGVDGDGDLRRDPRNPVDAIFAAARYLRDAGAAEDLPRAVFAYNHAGWYVDRVVRRAREFAGLDAGAVAALTARSLEQNWGTYRARGNPFQGDGAIAPSAGQVLLFGKHALTRLVLHSKDIKLDPGGRADIVAGRIDRRVLAVLAFLARSGLKPTVSCLQSGHSRYTTSGNISAHSYGHAVDIAAINGIPIAGHQGPDSITATTLAKLVELQGYLRPNQIITLMTMAGHDNTMAMGDHDDHIHVGFPRVATLPPGEAGSAAA